MTYRQFITSRTYYLLLGLILLIYTFVILVGKQLGPFRLLVVKSGSMEPILSQQSLILLIRKLDYNLQDMVTYDRYIIEQGESETITHRIVNKRRDEQTVFYKLQGDQNQVADGWIRHERIVGRVVVVMPLLGKIITAFRLLLGKVLLVAVPVLFFSMSEIIKIKQELSNSHS